ncbi:hypothetical protein VTN77DRAFT_7417 [Rasamsonia byssochlamydoides]|uniref:uncharacterized protein n=1 Tax=Rasamsonia byssochlamydoides TaxID=89139 RepID=UPI00374462D3
MAMKCERPRQLGCLEKDESSLFEEFHRLSQTSDVFISSYEEALREAAKTGNMKIMQFLLETRSTGDPARTQSAMLPWVNHTDEHGNTALYYACTKGNLDVFNALLEVGANPFTKHLPFPSRNLSVKDENLNGVRTDKVNLLQITLDALASHDIWLTSLRKAWGPIVCYFLDAGMDVNLDDPSLIKFFHISCFQGNLHYVEKLLGKGISLIAPPGISNDRDYNFGTPLHAATVAGRKAVASCLLNHSADVD